MVKPTQQTNQGSKWRNERTCALVEPFMMAAEGSGDPGNRGKGGPIGYFKYLAVNHPRAFVRILAQSLPLQMANEQRQGPLATLFEAIVMAPEAAGDPSNRGKGGAHGYFRWLLAKHPLAFCSLWPHILPLQMMNEQYQQDCIKSKQMVIAKLSAIFERHIAQLEAEEQIQRAHANTASELNA